MKKLCLLTITVLLIAIVTACSSNDIGNNEPTPPPQETTPPDLPPQNNEDPPTLPAALQLDIAPKTPGILGNATYNFDFLPAYAAHIGMTAEDFYWIQPDSGIAIWANLPLHNVQIVTLDHDWDEPNQLYVVSAILHEIAYLPANTPLVLSRFIMVGGVLPTEGITFEDESGRRRYFAILDNRRDDDPPFFLREFENNGVMLPQEPIANAPPTQPENNAYTLNWLIEPSLPYASITLCVCGQFRDENWQIIDPNTGQLTGNPHLGHGGGPEPWVYDPRLGLFGHSGSGLFYNYLMGMHPIADFEAVLSEMFGPSQAEWFLESANGLIIVEAVDYTMQEPLDWDEDAWTLPMAAFSGNFALMYNRELVTDFIYSGGNQIRRYFDVQTSHPFAAMQLGGMWGLVDHRGNTIMPFVFENLVLINESTAFARYNGVYGVLSIR